MCYIPNKRANNWKKVRLNERFKKATERHVQHVKIRIKSVSLMIKNKIEETYFDRQQKKCIKRYTHETHLQTTKNEAKI